MTDLGKLRSMDLGASFEVLVDKGTIPILNFTDATVDIVYDDGYQWMVGETVFWRDSFWGELVFIIDRVEVKETSVGDLLTISGVLEEKEDV